MLRDLVRELPVQRGDGDLLALIASKAAHGLVDQVHDRPLDGHTHGHRVAAEALAHGLHGALIAGARSIHLVDEEQPGDVEAAGLAPHGLGLGLHPAHRIQDDDRAVEHPHRPLHLDGEVHMARGVNDLDEVVPPRALGHSTRDGDAVGPLLLHEVHMGRPIVDLADLVGGTGVVQDALCQRGLARVNVGGDAHISYPVERVLACRQCGLLKAGA
jgi:hypothetical protein